MFRDLSGTQFGRWTVLQHSHNNGKVHHWLCRCECGTKKVVAQNNLISGASQSCGCLHREKVRRKRSEYRLTSIGDQFNRWTVTGGPEYVNDAAYWRCRCQCGNERVVFGGHLRNGASKSCGCHRLEINSEKATTHGMSKTRLYRNWLGMLSRCENPKSPVFHNYGGRGIKVCERWHDFEKFRNDMGAGWRRGLSLERINVDGNYEPSNCRWATHEEQQRNKRSNIMVNTPWGYLPLGTAAKKAGMSNQKAHARYQAGWTPEEALGLVPRKKEPPS